MECGSHAAADQPRGYRITSKNMPLVVPPSGGGMPTGAASYYQERPAAES